MKRILLICCIITGLLTVCVDAMAEREYHKRVGTGGYGVSTRKVKCSYCGKEIYASDSHVCYTEKPSSGSSSSRSSSSSSGNMSASEADAIMAGHPELLVNQCSFPSESEYLNTGSASDNGTSASGNDQNAASQALNTFQYTKKNSHWFRNTVILLAVIIGLWWLIKRRKKKKAPKLIESAEYVETSTSAESISAEKPTHSTNPPSRENSVSGSKINEHISNARKKIQVAADKASEMMEQVKNAKTVQDTQSRMQQGLKDMREKVADKMYEYSKAKNDGNQASIADEISKLNELKQAGVITEDEFTALKGKLLNK